METFRRRPVKFTAVKALHPSRLSDARIDAHISNAMPVQEGARQAGRGVEDL